MGMNANHRHRRSTSVRTAAACWAVGILAGLLSLTVSGAWSAGFSGADEPAHFLNTYLVADYLRSAPGSHPMAFAAEFYLHYPKISIGHWPPAYYALLSPFFLILPATPQTAFALNLLVSALPALLGGLLVGRLYDVRLALAGSAAIALTPVMLEAQSFFMLDAAVAAAALAATLIWTAHADRPVWWKPFTFALVAATAVLIKGNGWLLLFVPPLHLLLTGRWRMLLSPWPWAAAGLAGLLVGPWYWLTAGIAADGFNYAPGLGYALEALGYDLAALAANVTWPGLALAAWGAISGWRLRRDRPSEWNLIAGCIALVFATLLLQSLVPVDLDPRYMAPAIPPLVLLAFRGAAALLPRHRSAAVAAAALLIVLPGALHLLTREAKGGFRMEEAAALVPPGPAAWLIDGSSGAEGAFVAAMAVRDPGLQRYAVRSSKLLAVSDFMGTDYRLVTDDPADALARIRGLGIDGIAISRAGGEPAFPHSRLLARALADPRSPYRLVASLPHRGRPGTTLVYRARAPVAPNVPAIRALGLPGKAGSVLP
jgi:hypothetical protein